MQTVITEVSTAAQVGCPTCGDERGEILLCAPDRYHGRRVQYELLRCPSCSLVWLKDPPSPDDMGQHYGPDYDRSVAAAGSSLDRWRSRVEELAQYKTGGSILDLGCSSGGFLGAVKSPSWKLYGIEMSEDVAKKARADTGADIFVGDILDAPYRAGSFDAITCFHVFEHLYQPKEVLARVSFWLKPGGIFYAMMPNIDSAGARIFKSYWYALELPRHLYHFSPVSLRNAALSVGLVEISLTTHREMFIEQSTRYVIDEMCRKIGFERLPLSKSLYRSFPRRAVRKAFRLTLLPMFASLASSVGDGESIHAILAKPAL